MVQAIPERFGSITPYLIVPDGAKAIEFYEKAFGAMEVCRMAGPDGSVMHAELKFGDSMVMLAGGCPGMETVYPKEGQWPPVTIHMYVDDADAVWKQAVAAGCTPTRELQDMFWGDRFGQVVDPFHQHWSIAQHIEDVTEEEMVERQKRFMKEMAEEHAGQPA
jgi:uncharacterized glyoxalase superfamily protein PhnB